VCDVVQGYDACDYVLVVGSLQGNGASASSDGCFNYSAHTTGNGHCYLCSANLLA
jgi:hypothetical protein